MHRLTRLAFSLLLSLFLAGRVSGYMPDNYTIKHAGSWWLTSYYGTATSAESYGYSVYGLSWNYMVMEDQLFSVRLLQASEPDNMRDLGVLYGLLAKNDHGHIGLTGGIGIISGKQNPDKNTGEFTVIGVPVELQAIWTPMDYLGVGVIAVANGNFKNAYAGATLAILLGKVR